MQLSWHFTLEDLIRSSTAARHGLDNTPPEPVVENLKYLCNEALESIYQTVAEFSINSGYRSPEVNAKVGSKPTSAHCKGLAADIRCNRYTALQFASEIARRDFNYDQIIHEFGAWVHVAVPEKGKTGRKQLLTIDAQGVREGLHEARPPKPKV